MIKNKDGQEYKISKPNPLMKFQELWEKYTIHNFFWEELKEINFFKKTTEKTTKKEIKKIEEKLEEENEKLIKEEKKEINESKELTSQCYYIEANTTIKKDELYQDLKTKITYKEKQLIKIKIEQYSDLYFKFLSNKKLTKNSIIFPKNKDKRWWKITNEEALEEEEYVYYCIPSDLTPSLD